MNMQNVVKPSFRKSFVLPVAAIAGAAVVAVSGMIPAFAASVTASYSPASQSIANGSNVVMTVTSSAGSNHILTDQLRVTFDSSKLQFVSANYAGSPLDTDAPDAGSGSGYYQISRYSLSTHPTGNFTLATMTVSSGSTSVGYAAGNSSVYIQEDGGASNALTSVSGANYSFTSPPDTTQPSVSVTAPSNNATVSGGSVAFSANASDNIGVARVEFIVDGSVKNTDTSSPYATTIDSKTLSDGAHTFMAKSYDAAGNSAAASVVVNVKNNTTTTVANSGPVSSSPSATKPTGSTASSSSPSTATSNTAAGQAQTASSGSTSSSDGVQVAADSPYAVKPLSSPGNTKRKLGPLAIVGIMAVSLGAIVGGFALFRIIQRHRVATIVANNMVSIPQQPVSSPDEGLHQQPIAPGNIPPGTSVFPNNHNQNLPPGV